MDKAQLIAIIEALLFVATEPVTLEKFKEVTEQGKTDILEAVSELRTQYDSHKGVQLASIAGGYQLVSRPESGPWVRKFLTVKTTGRLSKAGIETLSIIAYKQPIVLDEIEKIRGVDCGGVLRTLLEKGLIRFLGRKQDTPGSPYLYGTTKEFLRVFGLNTLSDLPALKDFKEEDLNRVGPEETNILLADIFQNNG